MSNVSKASMTTSIVRYTVTDDVGDMKIIADVRDHIAHPTSRCIVVLDISSYSLTLRKIIELQKKFSGKGNRRIAGLLVLLGEPTAKKRALRVLARAAVRTMRSPTPVQIKYHEPVCIYDLFKADGGCATVGDVAPEPPVCPAPHPEDAQGSLLQPASSRCVSRERERPRSLSPPSS